MIVRLRKRHRRLIGWVGIIALLGFLAALAARPSRPFEPAAFSVDSRSWTEFGPDDQLRAARASADVIVIARGPRLVSPDLLAYWAPASEGEELPADAVLLGAVGDPGSHTYALPNSATGGDIVIFSLGHGHVVATLPVAEMPLLDSTSRAVK